MDLVKRLRSGEDGLEYAAADEIDGLEEDLKSAIEVAWNRGAQTWVRDNYPAHAARLAAQHKEPNRA